MSSVYFVIYVWAVYINFCFVKLKTTTTLLETQIYGSFNENHGGLLFSIDEDSLISAASECTSRCQSVRQCLGLEICKIASDRYRCRACCSWLKLGQQMSTDDKPTCKYYQMIRDDDMEYRNVALNKPAELSTMWDPDHKPGYAVNNKLICPTGKYHIAATMWQVDPWLEINLQLLFEIRNIVIYARHDCCEPRTKHLELTVRDNVEIHFCGIYPGPTSVGDQILITCPLIKAQFVRVLQRSQSGETNVIQICELQVFGKPL